MRKRENKNEKMVIMANRRKCGKSGLNDEQPSLYIIRLFSRRMMLFL